MNKTIKIMKSLYVKSPKNKLFEIAIDRLCEDIIDELVATNEETLRELAFITGKAIFRWRLFSLKVLIKCHSCGHVLKSDCARYNCYRCDEPMMLPSKVLNEICLKCASYQGECQGSLNEYDLEAPIVISKRSGSTVTWPVNWDILEDSID